LDDFEAFYQGFWGFSIQVARLRVALISAANGDEVDTKSSQSRQTMK
jgi:hypothetical protein